VKDSCCGKADQKGSPPETKIGRVLAIVLTYFFLVGASLSFRSGQPLRRGEPVRGKKSLCGQKVKPLHLCSEVE